MADVIFPGETPVGSLGATKLPGNMDLSIWQGDAQTFTINLTTSAGTAVDLTGCTAQAIIRKDFTSATTYAFTCTTGANGSVTMYMSSTVSATIPAGTLVWNFQITKANGDVRTYLAGDVTVYAQVDAP